MTDALTAHELRRGFLSFFEERGHTVVPSASLIPHDPDLLFTVAGMVPFKPYFLGEETPPFRRATTVQKCVRAGGKDSDLEEVGKDGSHLSFFEMLGNFSFGDYFKAEAIPMAWEMVTELFGLDPGRLWVTVHVTDDEAEAIWRDGVGVAGDRIQRLDADNWWGPPGGPPGPCGPCSEIFVDKGRSYGRGGGPAQGADARYLEIWNLVFMQFNRDVDGIDTELPAKNIDTGAGLERILGVLQGVDSVYETDVLAPLVEAAQAVTGARLGASSESDVSLRILAEHARTMTFLLGDGVVPSNEDRGYVLRRIIRRAIRHAFLLGVDQLVLPDLSDAVVATMGESYPELTESSARVRDMLAHEEEAFRRTLAAGIGILDTELDHVEADGPLSGAVAFTLHDTHGFPLELTEEIAGERGIGVDADGFAAEMDAQRRRAQEDFQRKRGADGSELTVTLAGGETIVSEGDESQFWAAVRDRVGATDFVGRDEIESKAQVVAVGAGSVLLDASPFYAESGGQVGDTGTLAWPGGSATVTDTVLAVAGLHRHLIEIDQGVIEPGLEVVAAIDAERRDAIRRNHTGTHILHWALREVLGPHVQQQGSHVGPDRLRFDFSHYEAVSPDQLSAIEDLATDEILANHPVRHYETTRSAAEQSGAIAFFGDKYGDIVRVLEAGPHSVELCGGTHVRALGDIGPVHIVAEGSIGSNIRRVEAVTGHHTLERLRARERERTRAADILGVGPDELVGAVQKRVDEIKQLRKEVASLRSAAATGRAGSLAARSTDGVLVERIDGLDRGALRSLAVELRGRGLRAVVLGGEADGGGAALVAAVDTEEGFDAAALLEPTKALIKGGGRGKPDLMALGGGEVGGIDPALAAVREALGVTS